MNDNSRALYARATQLIPGGEKSEESPVHDFKAERT